MSELIDTLSTDLILWGLLLILGLIVLAILLYIGFKRPGWLTAPFRWVKNIWTSRSSGSNPSRPANPKGEDELLRLTYLKKVESITLTSFLAVLTPTSILTTILWGMIWGGILLFINLLVLAIVLGLIGISIWYLLTREGTKQNVPEFHIAVLNWIGDPLRTIFLYAGIHLIPRFLGYTRSEMPVPKTVFEHHDEAGNKRLLELDHFTPSEANGFVFIGERLFQELVSIQSKNRLAVLIDANFVMDVHDGYRWKRSANPYGTVLGRFEAALRTVVSMFNGEDINDLQSIIPSMMLGEHILVARSSKRKGDYNVGDLVRDKETGDFILEKFGQPPTDAEKQAFVMRLNDRAHDDCKPQGGFTEHSVKAEHIGNHITNELDRLGGRLLSISIEDVTLPKSVEDAAAKIAEARANRVTRLTEAETAKLSIAQIGEEALDSDEKIRAAEIILAQDGKATYIIGSGSNAIAQLGGILKGTTP